MAKEAIRLVQITHHEQGRRVALVREPDLLLLQNTRSVYELAMEAIHARQKLQDLVQTRLSAESVPYDEVYHGTSAWRLLPSFDHPDHPMSCIVAGTGLTHKNSALNRQMMHQADAGKLTDSMQMYQWGLEGGQPEPGTVGVQPEWFYKGTGHVLRAHGEALEVPPFGNDGGEEPEVAGLYVVDQEGKPWRIGFSTGNEFSDHVMEKKNYLYLAPSKLRTCAIGPELVVNADFEEITGHVRVRRGSESVWEKKTKTGEKNMAHSLANLEHHHFKYPGHRVPLQAHVHFFGADAFSFGDQVQLQEGDVMEVAWDGMGRTLQNPLHIAGEKEDLMQVSTFR
jgi:hypothetical protein